MSVTSMPANLPPVLRRLHLLRAQQGAATVRVIDQILENPEAFLPLTIAELSEAAQTSDATVVRLVQQLGFGGYQEFKLQLSRALAVERKADIVIEPSDAAVSVLRKVFDSAATALSDTLEHLQLEDFTAAVQAMGLARRIELIGLGSSGTVARDGQYRALRLGLSCGAHTDPGTFLPLASLLEPTDVLIAVSFSGASADVLRGAKLARQNQATVIAITGLGRTPLSRIAHHTLHASAPSDDYRPESLSAKLPQMALLDALFSALHVSQEPYLSERLSRAKSARKAVGSENF